MRRSMIFGCVFVVTASASAQMPPPSLRGTISPAAAVAAAAAAHIRDGKQGTFGLLVRSTGTSNGHVFLNSEADYHNPNNLSIDIDTRAAKLLTKQLGSPPDQFYKDKWIAVRGTARRVPIFLMDDYSRSMRKFYYQTHVFVREPGQISVAAP